jgi:hypothetical protein
MVSAIASVTGVSAVFVGSLLLAAAHITIRTSEELLRSTDEKTLTSCCR